MTALQRQRLDAAVAALQEAGTQKLHGRLFAAFLADDWERIHETLSQARSWSVNKDGEAAERARDAVGLLWAVVEVGL